MRTIPLAVAACVLSGAAAGFPADEPPGKGQPGEPTKMTAAELDRLILQLGDDDPAKRVLAGKRLEALGEAAVAGLKKAADDSDDPEVRKAARALLEKRDLRARGVLHTFAGDTATSTRWPSPPTAGGRSPEPGTAPSDTGTWTRAS